MKLTGYMKAAAVLFLLVVLCAYVFLVDLGMNAGRVHQGVSVDGFDIGGQTFAEAEETLARRGDELKRAPVIFGAEGFDCRFIPHRIGWGPQPHDTAEAAMAVGRPVASIESLGERLDAWVDGVRVSWADEPNADSVDRILDECERNARALGAQLNRSLLRELIGRAIVTWPRPAPFPVPFID